MPAAKMPAANMPAAKSYAGTVLRVDLCTGASELIETRQYAGRFLGGRGLAAAIYWNEVTPEIDAFDQSNRLILSLGPLAGIPGLGGSRWGVYAKAPLPQGRRFCYGNLGGTFGAELKFAGYDGLILQGKADRPAILSIRDGEDRLVETARPVELREIARELRGHGRGNVKVWGIDFMAHGPKTRKLPCYGCPANCLRVRYRADDGTSGKFMCQSRFFYMPHAWGYYGQENDVPFHANRLCDQLGIDTWEVQSIIEWLLRCRAEGVITEAESGLPLDKVGSLEFIELLLNKIVAGEDFGALLAKGARAAAQEKGPAARAARMIQDRQYAKESLVTCDWMYPVIDLPKTPDHVGDPALESRILSAATGIDYTAEDLDRIGARIFELQRAILLREGHRAHLAGLDLIEVADELEGRGLLARRARRVPPQIRLARRLASGLASGLGSSLAAAASLGNRVGRLSRDLPEGSAAPAMSREQLLELLEEQRSRYGHPQVVHNFRGWNKAMQYHISDFDEYFLIRMVDGEALEPEPLSAPLERPEVSYQMDSETLRAMTRREITGAEAFRRRRLKLKASFSDIMKLQSLDRL